DRAVEGDNFPRRAAVNRLRDHPRYPVGDAVVDERRSHRTRNESGIDVDNDSVDSKLAGARLRPGRDRPLASAHLRLAPVYFRSRETRDISLGCIAAAGDRNI